MTKETTITQALAELKTINKRIENKTQTVGKYLTQPDDKRDPLERQGGSAKMIEEERQSIDDLWVTQIRIRRAVEDANIANEITVEGVTRSIAEWLIWRREVAKSRKMFLSSMAQSIARQRELAHSVTLRMSGSGQEARTVDIIVNLNEKELMNDIEHLDSVMGQLDGQLSLKNATLFVSY